MGQLEELQLSRRNRCRSEPRKKSYTHRENEAKQGDDRTYRRNNGAAPRNFRLPTVKICTLFTHLTHLS